MMHSACMSWMGVDPGKSGAIVVIGEDRSDVEWITGKDTDHDIDEFVRQWDSMTELAIVEKVSATPQMGVSSSFNFGRSFGFMTGIVTAHRIPIEFVSPAKWQGFMKCRTGGDKNISKAAAQRLFPHVKVTHQIADALLLAEYSKRIWASRHPATSGET